MHFFTVGIALMALVAAQSCCAVGSTSTMCKIEQKIVDCATVEGLQLVDNWAQELLAVMEAIGGDYSGIIAQIEAQSPALAACVVAKVMAKTKSPVALARATVYLDGLKTRKGLRVGK